MEEIKKFLKESNYFSEDIIEEMIKCLQSEDYCAFWIYFYNTKNIEKFEIEFDINAYKIVQNNIIDKTKKFYYPGCTNKHKYEGIMLNIELYSSVIDFIKKEIEIPDVLYEEMMSIIRSGDVIKLWRTILSVQELNIKEKIIKMLFNYLKKCDIIQYELLTNSYYFDNERFKIIDIYRGPEFLKEIVDLIKSE